MNFNLFRVQHFKLRTFSLSVCQLKKTNHYDCLGITPKATQGDIKTAYYKLSKQYHPDVNRDNADAAEKFRDIKAAYEVLGNLKSRKLYDRGFIVGTHKEIYTSEESEEVNIKHASFHKHRNKPTKYNTVTSTNYNIDEWTKAHYSNAFSSAYSYKTEKKENIEREEESSKQQRNFLEMIVVSCGFLAIMYMLFEYIGSDNDQPDVSENISDGPKPKS